jgi:hypothetical protein
MNWRESFQRRQWSGRGWNVQYGMTQWSRQRGHVGGGSRTYLDNAAHHQQHGPRQRNHLAKQSYSMTSWSPNQSVPPLNPTPTTTYVGTTHCVVSQSHNVPESLVNPRPSGSSASSSKASVAAPAPALSLSNLVVSFPAVQRRHFGNNPLAQSKNPTPRRCVPPKAEPHMATAPLIWQVCVHGVMDSL